MRSLAERSPARRLLGRPAWSVGVERSLFVRGVW